MIHDMDCDPTKIPYLNGTRARAAKATSRRGHGESPEISVMLWQMTQMILAIMTILGISGDIYPGASLNSGLLTE